MCLGIPVKVIEVKENHKAVVEFGGVKKQADLRFTPNVKEGDFVVLHAGFSIQSVKPEEVKKTYRIIEDIK